jgi:hypothetical protein
METDLNLNQYGTFLLDYAATVLADSAQ